MTRFSCSNLKYQTGLYNCFSETIKQNHLQGKEYGISLADLLTVVSDHKQAISQLMGLYDGVSFNKGSTRVRRAAADETTPNNPTEPGLKFRKPRAVNGITTSHAFLTVSTMTSL